MTATDELRKTLQETGSYDVPSLHEIVDLADDFNTAMETNDHAAAKSFFAIADLWPIELRTFLLAVDMVRAYWGEVGCEP